MPLEFADSPRGTLGIEWELALIDRESSELASIGPEIVEELDAPDIRGAELASVAGELLQNTVELISSPHHTVGATVSELGHLAEAVLGAAEKRGAAPICAGSHPFSRWGDQSITRHERYDRFIERTQWWGRNMLIWGVHVHLGVDDKERVAPLLNAMLTYLPHLQALSASSPFWAGEQTGYASNRALWFQQLPTAGLPWEFQTYEEYERIIDDLVKTGIIAEVTEARWDIRPAPKWGTIEVRVCDGISTLWEIGALAAFTQCLFMRFNEMLDAGEELPRLQPWFIRENKWRSARYGLDAEIIVDADGTSAPIRDHISWIVDRLTPVAARIGCSEELGSVRDILERGSSAERQLAVLEANGGMENPRALNAVVESVAQEFAASISNR